LLLCTESLQGKTLERYQQQVTHTSALLVLIFTLLWLPSYILMFSIIRGTLASSPGFNTFALLARLLSSSVAVVNPLLYGFMSQKFRRDLVEMGRESWTRCRSCLICCPRLMSRHTKFKICFDSKQCCLKIKNDHFKYIKINKRTSVLP
uniref:G-protein coupled receptors family 1 profile domain-containing protein n=1 Tax=Poecilia latipinna TaxID=48699 RepID=A0A3B3W1K5_9TELE